MLRYSLRTEKISFTFNDETKPQSRHPLCNTQLWYYLEQWFTTGSHWPRGARGIYQGAMSARFI